MKNIELQEVYVVMAIETGDAVDGHPNTGRTCYCVCDSDATAKAVIRKDTEDGSIHPGARIELHALQTPELV